MYVLFYGECCELLVSAELDSCEISVVYPGGDLGVRTSPFCVTMPPLPSCVKYTLSSEMIELTSYVDPVMWPMVKATVS